MNDHADVALLTQAVQIASPSTHEAEVAQFLAQAMQARGIPSTIDRVGNVVGQIGSHGPEIVLLGHIDTAPGHVPVHVQDGKLYGRGSVDAKGSFVTFICAAARLAQHDALPFRLTLIGAVEEEYATSRGAHFAAQRHHPQACIIGEPSGWNRVTLGYKGRVLLTIATRQASAHSAGAEPSAPERCMAVWQRIQHYCADFNRTRPRLFDQIMPSLRQISSHSDGICDTADATVGLRLPADLAPDALMHHLSTLADAHTTLLFRDACTTWQSPRNDPCATALVSSIRHHGGQPGYLLKTGTADMNVVAPRWRCPIVAYGPGDSSLDHTPDEHIDLDEFAQAVAVLTHALPVLATRLP